MKNKFFALLLSFVMIFTLNISVVMAAGMSCYPEQGNYTFDYDTDKGEKFVVNFIIDGNEGYNNSTFRIKYNSNVVRLVENEASDLENDGFITYEILEGRSKRLFTNSLIESQLNLVPAKKDKDYESLADGSKTASEIGIVKIGQFISSVTDVFDIYENGIFISLTFEVVGAGQTEIELVPAAGSSYIFKGVGSKTLSVDVSSASVFVSGEAETTTEKTTEKTETTTSSSNSGNTSNNNSSQKTTTEDETDNDSNDEDETETTSESNDDDIEISTSSIPMFNDLSSCPWAEDAINTLASKSIINGLGNGVFNPTANVKRADFLLMLMKALNIEGEATTSFADVDANKYYANSVNLAKEKGIANGDSNGNFNPEANISRQDMMVLAFNALKVSEIEFEAADNTVLDKFNDNANISEYAKESLATMVNAGIVNGMGDSIQPKGQTTRAQAAVIIYNIYNAINK